MSNWTLYSIDEGDRVFLAEGKSPESLQVKARKFRKLDFPFPFIITNPQGKDVFRCDGETRTGKFQRWIWL